MLCHCVKMQNARAEQSSPGSACQSEPQLVYSNSQARHRHTLLSALSWFPINVYGWLVFRTDARGEGYTQQGEQILALQMYQRIVSRSKSWGQKNQAAVRYCVLCHNMVVKGEWRHLLSHSYLISVVHALEIWTSFFVCFCIKQTKHNTNKKKNPSTDVQKLWANDRATSTCSERTLHIETAFQIWQKWPPPKKWPWRKWDSRVSDLL